MKNYIFYAFFFMVVVVLLYLGVVTKDKSMAIVAEVDAQRTAISYSKPVRIKAVHVKSGQHVKSGDLMLEVERPDLDFEIEKVTNDLALLRTSLASLRTKFQTELNVLELQHDLKLADLNRKIETINIQIKQDSIAQESILAWSSLDSTRYSLDESQILIQSLNMEKSIEIQRYNEERKLATEKFNGQLEENKFRQDLISGELETLKTEKANLIQRAPFNGTIGNVGVQLDELIPPFKTIISVYDESPDIIRGFLNEKENLDIQIGQEVLVESGNRSYSIAGEIVEIGARIVPYPRQMISAGQLDIWGKEVFVQIPKQNQFLSGEKVYVIIQP